MLRKHLLSLKYERKILEPFRHLISIQKGWSAALAFAPVRRNPAQKAKPAAPRIPVGASVLGTVATSTAATIEAPFVPLVSTALSTATISAAPVLISQQGTEDVKEKEPEGDRIAQGWMKKIKPPSMVLDEDVNGFKDRKKRPGGGGGEKGKGKKKKKVCNCSMCNFFSLD